MVEEKNKFFDYLALFGLDQGYTSDQLQKTYRTLAKINHPDINKNKDSEIRMIFINEGYKYLLEKIDSDLNQKKSRNFEGDYIKYRSAFNKMKYAFDDYFGYEKSEFKDDNYTLKERLLVSKKEFAELLDLFPESKWAADTIDRIFVINLWVD